MLDLYIHAATEAAAKAALPALLDAEGNWCLGSHRWCFDPVGAVVDTPASFDAAGNLLAAATFLPGWHGNLRLLDVQINPGDTTLPHTHDSAILYTFISNGEGPLNGRVSSITTYVQEQYTHRVNNPGPGLFRIIALANYGPAVMAVDAGQIDLSPQLENEWFRSYRLELAPGQSSASYLHTNPVAIVQVSDGVLHVSRGDGITHELKAMGDWAWREAGVSYQIHNRSNQSVSVVINEGKR